VPSGAVPEVPSGTQEGVVLSSVEEVEVQQILEEGVVAQQIQGRVVLHQQEGAGVKQKTQLVEVEEGPTRSWWETTKNQNTSRRMGGVACSLSC